MKIAGGCFLNHLLDNVMTLIFARAEMNTEAVYVFESSLFRTHSVLFIFATI